MHQRRAASMSNRLAAPPRGSAGARAPGACLSLNQGQRSAGAARPFDQLQGRDHQNRARWWQRRQVGELGQSIFVGAQKKPVAGEMWVEGVRRARVSADRLHADAVKGALARQPLGKLDVDAWGMRSGLVRIQEGFLVIGPRVPAGAIEQPGALGRGPVLSLEGADVIQGQEVIRIGLRLLRLVDDDRGADQPPDRNLRDIVLILTGDPVDGGVEVGAGMFAAFEPVPVPGRAFVVVAAHLVRLPVRRVGEGRWKLDHRRALRQRLGQVDDVNGTGGQALDEGRQAIDARTQFTPPFVCSARGNSKRFSSMWTSIKKLFGISASTLATIQLSWSPSMASSAASSKSPSSRTICARGNPAALAIPARSVPVAVAVVNHL